MISVEYRIGNILNYKDKYQSICRGEITNVSTDKVVFDHKHPIKHHNLMPIPLTEEWLLKFGFIKDDSGVEMDDPDYCEWYERDFPVIGTLCQSSDKEYLFDMETDTLRIKYVHQLQNLYFALTGEELTISEK